MNYEDIVDRLKTYAEYNDKIDALLVIGSYAREEMEPYSDLDIVIVSQQEPVEILNDIANHFGSTVEYKIAESEEKSILFLSKKLLRVDLLAVKDPLKAKTLFQGSRIQNLNKSILVDKTHSLYSKLENWNSEPKQELSERINTETNKFLISFESASSAARKGDVFQSYFQHNLALTRLARLTQLEKGDDSNLYLPKNLMYQLPVCRRSRIERINGTLRIHDLPQKIESLAVEFGETYGILYSKYSGLEKAPEEIRSFFNKIQTRDMVWNFRDISWIAPNKVQEGCLFRSSALARFDGKVSLSNWLAELGVKRIIDLRRPSESGRFPYCNVKIEIANVPMGVQPKDQGVISKDSEDLYVQLLDNPKVISTIFSLLSEKIPTIIHCYVGIDRTGVIIALIELLLGLSEKEVRRDYEVSYMTFNRSQFDAFLGKIRELGGIEKALELLGTRKQDIIEVKNWLIRNDSMIKQN